MVLLVGAVLFADAKKVEGRELHSSTSCVCSLLIVIRLSFAHSDLIDVSTPEAIVQWMENIAEKHRFALRTDAYDPGAPFDGNPAFGGKY